MSAAREPWPAGDPREAEIRAELARRAENVPCASTMTGMIRIFFVGCHQPADAHKVHAAFETEDVPGFEVGVFISRNRIRERKSGFKVKKWVLDSSAFMTILKHAGYPDEPEVYGAEIKRWSTNGQLLAAVTQDYMCEPHMLAITGMTVEQHQQLTIERYDRLRACDLGGVYLMPVLQGYDPAEYVAHLRTYGERIPQGAWVGVGSVCKRNGDPAAVEEVLIAILEERPDLLLHGFGIKTTALSSEIVQDALHTADTLSWSFAARKQGRNANDIAEAIAFVRRLRRLPVQGSLLRRMVA